MKQWRSHRILLLSALLSACGPEPESKNADTDNITDTGTITTPVDKYTYINELRTSAGMSTLSSNSALAASAQNHSQYLATNNVIAHSESSGLPGYTGATPGQRAVFAGYSSLDVGEGIANGDSANDAIDNLMSAIYHRFGLFDFSIDEIGFGYVSSGLDSPILVHNTGNRAFNNLCQATPSTTPLAYYTNVCSPDIKIAVADYDAARDNVIQKNPAYVVWPPENGNNISPAFFEESPDPLDDYAVSGYPISIQFNSSITGNIILNSFRLYDVTHGHYVSNTRLLDATTDPNGKFTTHEFALFPLERLNWSTQYRAELDYTETTNKSITWSFTTKSLDGPIITAIASDNGALVNNGVTSYLYFVPADGQDIVQTFRAKYPATASVSLSFYDGNTLRIKVSGNIGEIVTLTLNEKRIFTLTIK